jgi:hypothetical protein
MATMVMVIMEWHNRRMNNEYGSKQRSRKAQRNLQGYRSGKVMERLKPELNLDELQELQYQIS